VFDATDIPTSGNITILSSQEGSVVVDNPKVEKLLSELRKPISGSGQAVYRSVKMRNWRQT
jgi:hypothetical protein